MSDLTPAKLQELESALLLRRQELQARIDPQLHRSDESDELVLTEQKVADDNAVIADVLNDTDLAELELDLAVLVEIDAALGRIKAGTYGICTACEEAIPLARLQAMPSAHFCIGCQAKSEERQGFPHSASL
ncbi:TraR/DksA family transcriptional regulator [Actimicrobium sp. CCI2.3]|uniref:TraR/DksA family transcriptional regulator n=1 Tax=Actimicrobium sp. CCI2.3 TaxID=3048616 RepID=UPI002AB3FFEC|nr:TraR/DksA C4-type zinc finger protein [Actimicrobium sp. CCI2.3]MDY7575603.1 TraR/DksA C4-type zinc finger protein [Actimicrobium sp. CCI2.3]MEB0022026.1 TraR/DksA C4-type zinc finger protein [Actimicrobium sp. CCI2.3]